MKKLGGRKATVTLPTKHMDTLFPTREVRDDGVVITQGNESVPPKGTWCGGRPSVGTEGNCKGAPTDYPRDV